MIQWAYGADGFMFSYLLMPNLAYDLTSYRTPNFWLRGLRFEIYFTQTELLLDQCQLLQVQAQQHP